MERLDDIDRQIIDILRHDGRRTAPQLAIDLGIGRATAYNRLDRLIDDGVITGFSARVDHHAVGQTVAALVLVNVEQGRWQDLTPRLQELIGTEWVGVTAGQYDYAIIVRADSLDHLRDVALKELQQVEGVRSAQTIVLLDEVDLRHRAPSRGLDSPSP
ncbi:MAG: Lrp/AsnC family transcriptional regulator [Myxococcota bacterium]|nr:Lrp/AsnC family transcriptional regulator [Myxococcota bacterium]